jgi:hypothetical protein
MTLNSRKTWRSQDDTSKVYASPTVWHLVSPELCRPHADWHSCAAWQCKQWIYLMFVLRYAVSEASDSNGLHLLHHYVIWSPEGGLPLSPPGPLWMDSPHSTPSLSWATHPVDCTALYKCLPMCLTIQMHISAVYTATAPPQEAFSSTCFTVVKI